MSIGALFVGAHPDDADLLAGGTMIRMARNGHRIVLADATRGEMGTRGTPHEREVEAAEAAKILGVERTNLGLPDGRIGEDMAEAVRAVVIAIREFRPRLIVTHAPGDHHPDHNALADAVKQAFFLSNVLKYDTGQKRHAPTRLLYFWANRGNPPPENVAFISDITEHFETKLKALRAHRSQFANPDYDGPATYLSSDLYWHAVHARAAYFGSLIRVKYGEVFLSDAVLRIDDPLSLPDLLLPAEPSHA